MQNKLSVERLYSLGDYKNIKFINELDGIPESFATNPKAMELLFFQQTLACEIAYRKYYEVIDYISTSLSTVKGGRTVVDAEQAMAYLLEQREQTFAQLYEEIKKTQEVNRKPGQEETK
jgi:hypothetical protein